MDTKKRGRNIQKKNNTTQEQLDFRLEGNPDERTEDIDTAQEEPPDTPFFSDIDLRRWKDYDQVLTDSLWIMNGRDRAETHTAELHGNFIPQIPHQAMLRYTKRGDVVLDTFSGNGTTLIECRRLGRYGVGIELIPDIAERSRQHINQAANPRQVKTEVIEGDSRLPETIHRAGELLEKEYEKTKVQLIIMHPPYHDIIKFSDDPRDLCNAPSTEAFLEDFALVVQNSYDLLEDKRFLALVIGDKYTKGEWIPLGFLAMQKVLENGYKLKSIVVKNIEGNRAKRNLQNFWRRRALKWGFYVFKHEYVMFFQKIAKKRENKKV